MRRQCISVFHYIKDFLLPARCINCVAGVQEGQGICITCWNQLTFIKDPQCYQCGIPFDFHIEHNALCVKCLQDPPPATHYRAVFAYRDAVKDMILKFKHGDGTFMAPTFARWLACKLPEFNIVGGALFTPVPLHWQRLFKRQYNQAGLLAQHTADISGHHYVPDLLIRTRHTPPQGHLKRDERLQNIHAAIIVNPKHAATILNQTIVIFDDVLASGATVNECANLLKQAGAKTVHVLTLARTIKNA